jgi:hypothetical protein
MAHTFFTSYARSDSNKYSRLKNVVDELKERVRAKLGVGKADTVAFFDASDIAVGADWERVLGDAVRHAPVLVCLCSPTFFNSEFCACEFEVFRRRVEAAGPGFADARVVVPVIWDVGTGAGWMPSSVTRFYYKDDRMPPNYATDGLCVLRRIKGQREAFTRTIEVLAEAIALAASRQLPPSPAPVRFDDLPRSFHNPVPDRYNAAVLVLHDDGLRWKPSSSGTALTRVIDNVTCQLRIGWREVSAGVNAVQELIDARDRRQASVLLTTDADAASPRWSALIRAIDEARLDNCAVLVDLRPPTGTDIQAEAVVLTGLVGATAPHGEDVLRRAFPTLTGTSAFHACFSFESEERLHAELTRAIEKVRLALIAADPPGRITDPDFETHVGVVRRPILAGPGGGVG